MTMSLVKSEVADGRLNEPSLWLTHHHLHQHRCRSCVTPTRCTASAKSVGQQPQTFRPPALGWRNDLFPSNLLKALVQLCWPLGAATLIHRARPESLFSVSSFCYAANILQNASLTTFPCRLDFCYLCRLLSRFGSLPGFLLLHPPVTCSKLQAGPLLLGLSLQCTRERFVTPEDTGTATVGCMWLCFDKSTQEGKSVFADSTRWLLGIGRRD